MQVYLNIYDITRFNKLLCFCGVGLYHTGIEVGCNGYAEIEISYGYTESGSGVYSSIPRMEESVLFERSVYLGDTALEMDDVI